MILRLIPALLLLTGATGLLDEVVLGRLLALHLGSSGSSQAIALATFLGGLALGAVLVEGPLRGRVRALARPFEGYALLEAFIGAWAIALPELSARSFSWFADAAASQEPGGAAIGALKLALAALLALPLTTAMGATLPVLAAGVERIDPDRGVLLVSRYYAWNALGAAAGAGLTGFVLIEQFGLIAPLGYGGAVNLGVAAIAWWFGRAARPVGAPTCLTGVAGSGAAPPPWDLVVAAFATGFAALCAEVLWTRIAALTMGSSAHSFAFMLTVTILGIAAGSAIAARAARRFDPQWVLAASQAIAALCTGLLVLRLDALPVDLARLRLALTPDVANYPAWLLRGNGLLALHLLPAALALGASFPALLACARARGAATDRSAARLLGANTLGNLVGALGCGFAIMPALNVEGALSLTFLISLAVAVAMLPRPWRGAQLAAVAAVALTIGPLLVVAAPDGFVLTRGLFRLRDHKPSEVDAFVAARRNSVQLLYRKDGKDATISVDRFPSGVLNFRTNGKADGGTGTDVVTQVTIGHLGPLHRPHAARALTIGLGTGQTAAALASHADLHVHVVELSEAVREMAPIFQRFNARVWENPRVKITIADAREVLRTLPDGDLDVVVSEPSNPWVVGVADLFTADSFARISRKLRSDGVLVQWLQHYELADDILRAIVCTLRSVFAHVVVYRLSSGDLALVASNRPLALDFAQAEAVLARPGVVAHFDRLDRSDLPRALAQFLAAQLCGTRTVDAVCRDFSAPLRELHPMVEYLAPRDFFAQTGTARALAETLDTRKGAPPAGDTDLPRLLAGLPLDPTGRAALHAHLIELNHPFDTALVGATAPADKPPKAIKKAIGDLADPDHADANARDATCTRLRKDAPWLIKHPQTLVGPATVDPRAARWAAMCRAAAR